VVEGIYTFKMKRKGTPRRDLSPQAGILNQRKGPIRYFGGGRRTRREGNSLSDIGNVRFFRVSKQQK